MFITISVCLLIYNIFYSMIFLFNVQFLLFNKWIVYTCLRNIIIIFGRTVLVNGYPHCGNRGWLKHKELSNQRVSHYTSLLSLCLVDRASFVNDEGKGPEAARVI